MGKLTHRYVRALLELSQQGGRMEQDKKHATLVLDGLSNADVQAFLAHPHVSDEEKTKLFDTAFSNQIGAHLMGFLHLMVRKNRETFIVPVLTEYIEQLNKQLGNLVATVVSARPLTEQQTKAIHTLLSKQVGGPVELTLTVDRDVIGGFYVVMDGRLFDGTVRFDLNSMKERLKRGNEQWDSIQVKSARSSNSK